MDSIIQTIKKFKNIIIGALVIIAAGVAYNVFFAGAGTQDDGGFIRSENQSIVSSELGREIVSTLNRLKGINIDPEFFQDTRFAQLIDFSVELEPQPVGKLNPFRPVDPFEVQETSETVEGVEVIGGVTEQIGSDSANGGQTNGSR